MGRCLREMKAEMRRLLLEAKGGYRLPVTTELGEGTGQTPPHRWERQPALQTP